MTHSIKFVVAGCISMLVLSSCTGAPTQVAETRKAEAPELGVDLRQREQVSTLCVQDQIRGWRQLDDRAVIRQVGKKDEYKLDLTSGCEPESNFMKDSIRFVTRGPNGCLANGAELVKASARRVGKCTTEAMYKWERDAGSSFGGFVSTQMTAPMGVSR